VEHYAYLPSTLVRWMDDLRDRQQGDLAVVLVKFLRLWGFAIGQALWMLAPFVGRTEMAAIAETLEDPEAMAALYAYVTEGLPPATGRVEGD
jgi:hypothetical protein